MTSFNQSGSKYLREMKGLSDGRADVYAVIVTFDIRCPARQHAIKKILCSGLRGKGSELQDLKEARDAIDRAIQLHESTIQVIKAGETGIPGPPIGGAVGKTSFLAEDPLPAQLAINQSNCSILRGS